MSKVLLTGHNGYIGRVLAPMLVAAGHEVVGLDSDLFVDCVFGQPNPEIPSVRRDLRQITAEDVAGFDAIIHLAGICNDPLGNLDPQLTYDVNYAASLEMAKLAKAAGVRRFITSSSCSIYGAAGAEMVTESSPLNPVTAYGESKKRLDHSLAELADETFSPVYLRNATVYGISPGLRLDLVLNELVASAFTTGKIVIKSDGTPWRPIVHIEDVSRAFIAALEAPVERIHNQAFNVGRNSENYQIRDLADIVKEVVPNCEIVYAEGGGPDKRCYRVDCSKIEKQLPEFQPVWTARLGAEQLYEAYKKESLTVEQAESATFIRLRTVENLKKDGVIDDQLRRRELVAVA